MAKYEFGKCDYNKLEQAFDESCKNSDFSNMISKLDLPKEEMMKHTSKLEFALEESKNCQNCPGLMACKNKIRGYVFTPSNKDGKLTFSYDACKYESNRLELVGVSCNYFEMPEALKMARMKDVIVDDANRVNVIKWLKRFYDTYTTNPNQKGLYLHGSFGSGKTYLICAMLNELSKIEKSITVVYYPELLRSLKESFDKEDFGDRMSKIKNAKILFIDDIGAEATTAWSRDEILGTILQYRMDSKLPTFFSSNLSIDELEEHLSNTKNNVDKVKARRIIERIRNLSEPAELISKNRRN